MSVCKNYISLFLGSSMAYDPPKRNTATNLQPNQRSYKTSVCSEDGRSMRSEVTNDGEAYGFYCTSCQQLVQEITAENRCFHCHQLVLQGQRYQANDEDSKSYRILFCFIQRNN